MECALIPPIPLLSYNKPQKYQLCLPHLLKNGIYRRAYRGYCRTGKYVILDNGAAEAVKVKPGQLVAHALDLKVREVVAPDVLGNMEGTVNETLDFLRWGGEELQTEKLNVKIGIVAQGRDIQEALTCVAIVMRSYYAYRVSTVYIPRLLVTSMRPSTRVQLAEAIYHRWPELEIHMLGVSRKWLQEPLAIARMTPFVRSIDTSVPFTEAYYRRLLNKDKVGMPRPDDYFEWSPLHDENTEIVKKNVERFLGWTRGESIQPHTAKTAH